MKLLNLLLCLAIGLAVLVGASPTPEFAGNFPEINKWVPLNTTEIVPHIIAARGYDPSFEYHGYATVELWVGYVRVTVGSLRGGALFGELWDGIDTLCPTFHYQSYTCYNANGHIFPTGDTRGWTRMTGEGAWASQEIRRLMITTIAGAIEALVNRDDNCYIDNGHRICHIGDVIRLNLHDMYGKKNHMWITFSNRQSDKGRFDCCNSRGVADVLLDKLAKQYTSVFQISGDAWRRDVRCIINGWQDCPK